MTRPLRLKLDMDTWYLWHLAKQGTVTIVGEDYEALQLRLAISDYVIYMWLDFADAASIIFEEWNGGEATNA